MLLQKTEESEKLFVQVIENNWYITSIYPMKKTHYISFVAFATGDRIQIIKRNPSGIRVCVSSKEDTEC